MPKLHRPKPELSQTSTRKPGLLEGPFSFFWVFREALGLKTWGVAFRLWDFHARVITVTRRIRVISLGF